MSDSDDEVVDKKPLKLVFLGEPTVGKTSLIRKFCYDDFTRHYSQTIGAEFHMRNLVLPGKKEIKIRVTDIGGLELNGQMLRNYLFNTDIIIVVYDITNTATFDSLILWLDIIKKILGKNVRIAIYGNKSDLEHKRAVRLDKTQHFVNEYKIVNYLVSAKTGENVISGVADIVAKHCGLNMSKIDIVKKTPTMVQSDSPLNQDEPKEQEPVQEKSKKNSTVHDFSSVCGLQ